MRITVLAVGKTADKTLRAATEEYLGRIKHYVPFTFKTLPDVKGGKNMSVEKQKELEGQQFLANVENGDQVMLLDERGKEYSSTEFSGFIAKQLNSLQRDLVFVIGGPYGFSEEMYARANGKISLSKMTLTHEMVRLFFAEQIYRAFTIIRGEPYHHE